MKQLPSFFTTVTPISKFLAMILFVTLPFAGFYLGMQYGKINSSHSSYLSPVSFPSQNTSKQSWTTYVSKTYHLTFKHPEEFLLRHQDLTHEGTRLIFDELTNNKLTFQISSGNDVLANNKSYISEQIQFGSASAVLYKNFPQYFRIYKNGPISLTVFIPETKTNIFISSIDMVIKPEDMRLIDHILSTIQFLK